jgi:hypothetical protein
MKKCTRIISLLTLAVFLGFAALETCHSHKSVQSEANCFICNIVHRTPMLTNSAQHLALAIVVTRAQSAAVPQLFLKFVFVSHGLSPPVL